MGNWSYGSDKEITALLIAPNRDLANEINSALALHRSFQVLGEIKEYPTLQSLEVRMRQLKPQVVLLDVSSDLDRATDVLHFLTGLGEDLHVVGLHTRNDSETLLRALRAGASEFLFSPFEKTALDEAAARLLRLRQPSGGSPPPTDVQDGSLAVFTSTKPGAGSSTLATQVAFALKRATNKRVLLADFDLMGGSIGFYLKLNHPYSTVEALAHADSLDNQMWRSLTVPCDGIDILPAPTTPYTGAIEAGRVHILLNFARHLYDWVVVDLPVVFQKASLMAIAESDLAFLVTTPELPSLHLARKSVTLLEQIGVSRDRFQMVVNRTGKRDGIGSGDMEKLFNCPVYATVPNDYFSLHRVITLGQPLRGEGDLGKSIEGLAARMSAPKAQPNKANAPAGTGKPALSVS